MTTIGIKDKSVPEILDEKKALAAKGSCKTCQFCLKGDSQEMEYYCAIQGNVNTIDFTKAALNSKPYPYGPCDDGNWTEINDDGSREQIYGCLAYMLRTVEGVSYGDAVVSRQWQSTGKTRRTTQALEYRGLLRLKLIDLYER